MRDEKAIDSVMSMGTSVDIMVNVYVVGGEMMGWVYASRQRIEITLRRKGAVVEGSGSGNCNPSNGNRDWNALKLLCKGALSSPLGYRIFCS